jgi:uncharacterized membrane-anchored protein YjiN (DUF445 family)
MQWLATSLLGAMLVLFLVSAAYQSTHPTLHWVRAFAEAGAVGAMADWYAVVALFRHPLGLPIPHTAIIPKNKDRIGESLANFVEHNFLTPENVVRELARHNAAKALAEWLTVPANSRGVADSVCDAIPAILDALEDEDVKRFFDRTVTPQLAKLDISRIAGNALQALTAGERHQALLDRALQALERWLATNKGLVKAKFGEASRYTPAFLDSYIVDKFVEGIVALLREVGDNPQHELRLRFDEATQELTRNLRTSAEYRERGEALMHDLVEHLAKERYYRQLWDDVKLRVRADLAGDRSLIRETVESALVTLGKGLLDESAVQRKLNTWSLSAVETAVLRYRHQASRVITEVIKSWDAEEVARKVELEIGRDLQYIRFNGTLVGGIVGVVLHVLTTALAA